MQTSSTERRDNIQEVEVLTRSSASVVKNT